jgi:hypothetical protein
MNEPSATEVIGQIRLKPTVGQATIYIISLKCRRCAVKSQVGNLFFSGILGWWGFRRLASWPPGSMSSSASRQRDERSGRFFVKIPIVAALGLVTEKSQPCAQRGADDSVQPLEIAIIRSS